MGMKTKDEEKSKREFRNCAIAQNLNKVECFAPFMDGCKWRKSSEEKEEKKPTSFRAGFICLFRVWLLHTHFSCGRWAKRNGPSTTITRTMINNSPSYNHTKPREKKIVCIKNDISRLLIYQKTFKRTNGPKDKKNAQSYKAATTKITAQSICILNHLTPRVCCYLNQNILGVVVAVVYVMFSPIFPSLTVCIWPVFSMPFRIRVFHALSLSRCLLLADQIWPYFWHYIWWFEKLPRALINV